MDSIPNEIVIDILSYCDRMTKNVLFFVSTQFRKLVDNPVCSEGITDNYQLLKWQYETFYAKCNLCIALGYECNKCEQHNKLLIPNYYNGEDLEILDFLVSKRWKPPHKVSITKLETLKWYKDNNLLYYVDVQCLAKNGWYDEIDKERAYEIMSNWDFSYTFPSPNHGARELCIYMLNHKIPTNDAVLAILTGGGYTIENRSSIANSSQGEVHIDYYECPNLGSVYVKKALQIFNWDSTIDQNVFTSAIDAKNIDAFTLLAENFLLEASKHFYFALESCAYDIAEWIAINYHIEKFGILCDNPKILNILHGKGFEWDGLTYVCAAGNGNKEMIKYLYENGAKWEIAETNPYYYCHYSRVCYALAELGDTEIMEWCLGKGCPMVDYTINYSSTVEMLKYLENMGYKANSDIYANCRNLELLDYLVDNEYEITETTICDIGCYGYDHVKEWITENYSKLNIIPNY